MKNEKTIHEIQSQSTAILEKLGDNQVMDFKIKDLDISSGIHLGNLPVKGRAVNKIMKALKVRSNFTDFSQKMEPADWDLVSRKLKSTEAETKLYAKIVKDDKGQPEIVDVLKYREKANENPENFKQYFDWMCTTLETSEKEYALKDFRFNTKKDEFEIILLDELNRVDVFGTKDDLWKTGDRFSFNGLQFNYAPFFERLVCSNGNTALEYGYGADIEHSKYSAKKIESVIQKSLGFTSDTLGEQLSKAAQNLKENNVSIAEFYAYRKFFENRNNQEQYNGLIEKFFNDSHFFKAYGVNIAEKSNKWKSTANSGINAYDFFNMLTYIASHPKEISVDRDDRVQLQINASNLLFKRELDLQDIASPIIVDYPRHIIMN